MPEQAVYRRKTEDFTTFGVKMLRFLSSLFRRQEKPRVYKRLFSLEPLTGALEGLYVVEALDGWIVYVRPPITLTLED